MPEGEFRCLEIVGDSVVCENPLKGDYGSRHVSARATGSEGGIPFLPLVAVGREPFALDGSSR